VCVCIYIFFSLLLLNVVVSLLFCAARFLGGVLQRVFLFSVGFFLWPYVDVAVMCCGLWVCDVLFLCSFLFFPWPALMWRVYCLHEWLCGDCADWIITNIVLHTVWCYSIIFLRWDHIPYYSIISCLYKKWGSHMEQSKMISLSHID
jgi:hypothetical protein